MTRNSRLGSGVPEGERQTSKFCTPLEELSQRASELPDRLGAWGLGADIVCNDVSEDGMHMIYGVHMRFLWLSRAEFLAEAKRQDRGVFRKDGFPRMCFAEEQS